MSDHSKLRELAELAKQGTWAAFAAATSPDAVIALLDEIDRLRKDHDHWHSQTAKWREEAGREYSANVLAKEQLAAKDAEIERLESEIDRLNARIGGLT